MIYVFLIMIEAALLIDMFRRIPFASAPHGISLYCIAAQIVFLAAPLFPSELFSAAGNLWSFREPLQGFLLYFSIFCVSYGSTIGVKSRAVSFLSVGRTGLLGLAPKLDAHLPLLISAVYVHTALYLISSDHAMLWQNNKYLLINSSVYVSSDVPLAGLFVSTFQLTGVLSVALLGLLSSQGRRVYALAVAPVALFAIALAFATSSRTIVVYFAVLAFTTAASGARHKILPSATFGALALLGLFGALEGRHAGSFGLSAVPEAVYRCFAPRNADFLGAVVNLFQGVFVTADSLKTEATYAESYKLLSFSPLPSFIDGFDEIRRLHERRLHFYVPMSAVAEAVMFGPIYLLVAAATLFISARTTVLLAAEERFVMSIVLGTMLLIFFVVANAYPMRNVYRQILFVPLIYVSLRLFYRAGSLKWQGRRDFG